MKLCCVVCLFLLIAKSFVKRWRGWKRNRNSFESFVTGNGVAGRNLKYGPLCLQSDLLTKRIQKTHVLSAGTENTEYLIIIKFDLIRFPVLVSNIKT